MKNNIINELQSLSGVSFDSIDKMLNLLKNDTIFDKQEIIYNDDNYNIYIYDNTVDVIINGQGSHHYTVSNYKVYGKRKKYVKIMGSKHYLNELHIVEYKYLLVNSLSGMDYIKGITTVFAI